MIEKLEKQVKRNNKRKNINITTAVIIGFLLSSGITYGVDINNPISSDTTYNTDTTLNMIGKQIIFTGDGDKITPTININNIGKELKLEHTTEDVLSGYNKVVSIAAITGDININSSKLILNSNFKNSSTTFRVDKADPLPPPPSSPGIGVFVYNKDQITDYKKIILNANEIEINIESEIDGKNTYGMMAAAEGASIEILGDLKLVVNSKATSTGLSAVNGGKIIAKNNATCIRTVALIPAIGLDLASGEIDINSKVFGLDTTSEGNISIGVSLAKSNLNLVSENIDINTISKKPGMSYGIQGDNKSRVNINNKELLKIVTENTGSSGNAISLASFKNSEIVINSGNTIIKSSSNGTALGIQTASNGKVEINGGLEMYQTGKSTASVVATGGIVNLNKKNEAVAVKINGQMQANNNGVINLNLNGKDSFFIGKSYVDTGSKVNLGISNNAVWKNEDNSSVSNLNLDNGIIDMSYQSGGQKINIDTFSGNNGKIIMDISSADVDQTNGKTDFISIKNADREQKHLIEIGKSSIAGLLNYDFSQKILIGEASNKVRFEGSEFIENSSLYNYTLQLNRESVGSTAENNWYVAGVEKKESSTTEAVVDDISLHYMNAGLARMEADTLHKRLGDIRDLKNEAGVWSRVVSGQMEYDKNGYFKNNYTMIQAGVDKSETTSTGAWTTGFAVQRREGKTDFRNGDGKNESTGIALYKAWTGNSGNYLDLVGKYSHLKNEYKSYNAKNEKMEANYHTNVGTVSLEYGKRISKNKWYIQPHIQSTYSWIEGKNYMTSSNVRAQQKDINSLIGKAGVYAGYDFGRSSHFIKMGLLHEFMGDYGVTIKGEDTTLTKKMNGKDTWIELGVGGDIKVGKTDSTKVYYEIEKTFGGDFETNWQASLGIRHRF